MALSSPSGANGMAQKEKSRQYVSNLWLCIILINDLRLLEASMK